MSRIRIIACIVFLTASIPTKAGPFMAWNAGEYYMIDGDVVGPTTDRNNNSYVRDFVIRRLVIWHNGESDNQNRCYVNHDKNSPTLVYCEQVKGSSLSGAVWIPKSDTVFECIINCRSSVPKLLSRFLDGEKE